MVSPDAPPKGRIVWSDRPVFIWLGSVEKIAVRAAGSQEYLWTQIVTGMQSTNYTEKPLQPGQTYEWLVETLPRARTTALAPIRVFHKSNMNPI